MTVSHVLLFWKAHKLERFLTKLADGIDVMDCLNLIRWIYLLLLLYLVQVLYFVVAQTRILIYGDFQTIDFIIRIIFNSSIGPAYWIVSSSIFYWTVMQMMFLFQKVKLEHLKRYVSLQKLDYQVAYAPSVPS